MRFWKTIVTALTAAAALSAAVPGPAQAIIGGKDSSAPYGAQVYTKSGTFCSGAVIDFFWVITARHCVESGVDSVLVGSTKLGQGTRLVVNSVHKSPHNDIGLIFLSKPAGVAPIRLTNAAGPPQVGSTGYIHGWGVTCANCQQSPVLKVATVTTGTMTRSDAYNGFAISAGGGDGVATRGDSGGPLVVNNELVGIHSKGGPANTGYNSAITATRDWIRSVSNK